MPSDPRLRRRDCLGLLAGAGLVGLAGCFGDGRDNRTGNDNSDPDGDCTPTGTDPGADASPTDSDPGADGTPTDEPGSDGAENRVVRLSPVDDPREIWTTGFAAIYPTDLIGWLRHVATHDCTLRRRVSTAREMPDPPLQVLSNVRFVSLDDASFVEAPGEVTGHYDLEVEAGPYYEMVLGAEPADPPGDADVTPVGDLGDERRRLVVAAIEGDGEGNRVYSDTALAEWAREEFVEEYYRYEGDTYRGVEVGPTDATSSSTEAWYEFSAATSREGDDDTSVLLPDLVETVRAELDAAGVGERTDEFVVEDPSEPLASFADRMAMLVTHLTIFRVRVETR